MAKGIVKWNLDDDQSSNQSEKKTYLCENLSCSNSPAKHRHHTKDCLQHLLCAQDPLIPV